MVIRTGGDTESAEEIGILSARGVGIGGGVGVGDDVATTDDDLVVFVWGAGTFPLMDTNHTNAYQL